MKLLYRNVFILFFIFHSACTLVNSEEKVDLSFSDFLIQFNNDEKFQKTRIAFPLELESFSDDLGKIEKSSILKVDYDLELKFDNSGEGKDIDGYTQEIKTIVDTTIIEIRGIDNGINSDFVFIKKEGEWYLVFIRDYST